MVTGDLLEQLGEGPDASMDPTRVILTPCGGTLTVVPGRHAPPASGAMILLSVDASGQLDRDLAAAGGDASKLTGDYPQMTIIWSRGDLTTPVWLTVAPSEVEVSQAEPGDAPVASCPPHAASG